MKKKMIERNNGCCNLKLDSLVCKLVVLEKG